jgi:diadenosine tetraphosphate (Ap4A) HIT family hydrolase
MEKDSCQLPDLPKTCCQLGDIRLEESKVLYESDNFFVAPTIGPIGIEGYLLVLSKECFHGMGEVPESLYQELDEVQEHTSRVIEEVYGSRPQIFEHGPRIKQFRGGGCLDHAHLHIVPKVNIMNNIAVDLLNRLSETNKFYRVDRVEGYKRVIDIFNERKSSYFIAESPEKKRTVVEVNFYIPSQYMRRMIADIRGTNDWNWKEFPQLDVVDRTIETLTGKF